MSQIFGDKKDCIAYVPNTRQNLHNQGYIAPKQFTNSNYKGSLQTLYEIPAQRKDEQYLHQKQSNIQLNAPLQPEQGSVYRNIQNITTFQGPPIIPKTVLKQKEAAPYNKQDSNIYDNYNSNAKEIYIRQQEQAEQGLVFSSRSLYEKQPIKRGVANKNSQSSLDYLMDKQTYQDSVPARKTRTPNPPPKEGYW